MPVTQEAVAQAGAKRKRNTSTKFYAVRAGHKPGVYHDWDDCLSQVKGFKGAQFKSFQTLTDAERFVAGEDIASKGGSTSHHKFYAVRRGRVPGIYTDWANAQKQITGWTKPIYKGFSTRAEAQRFQDGEMGADQDGQVWTGAELVHGNSGAAEGPSAKKSKVGCGMDTNPSRLLSSERIIDGYNPALYIPPGAEDGFDTNIILEKSTCNVVFKSNSQREATKLEASGLASGSTLRIYTDGSSLRNGQKGAYAGVGVYFGPADARNISEVLPGVRQTNQRAELTAVVRALDTAPKNRDVTIVTDSEYAINCATKWYISWRSNGWKTANGKSVENRDIVEHIISKVEERSALQSKTLFEWIKGHANHPGNVEADKLAVSGARKAAQSQLDDQ